MNEISELKDCTVEEKSAGAFDGFVIKGKSDEKIFVKKDYNDLGETMLASKILYNMGLGPKVAFVPAKEGHFIISKDLNYTRNCDRKFIEGKPDILKTNPKANLQMYHISKILNISDIANNKNTGIVEKKGTLKGKIFDFNPSHLGGNSNQHLTKSKYYIDQFDAGKSGTITEKEFMKDVKLGADGKFMNKESRDSIKPRTSFETVVE